MGKTVLYGGTFNPIHSGHLNLCRFLLGQGSFDRILLTPAAAPPHKDAPELASGGDRLTMCRLAAADLPEVETEDWELARGGKSYTMDTVDYLRKRFPEDSLYLLIGSDMFLTFTQWKDWRRIGEHAILLVASREREDSAALCEQQRLLSKEGITSGLLSNPVMMVSSTEIRQRIAENSDFSGLPTPVADYCKERGLYSKKYDLEALRATVKPLQSPERYHHTLCVEQRAVQLARQYGMNPNKAAAAGILHDICKNLPQDVLLQICQSCDRITGIKFEAVPQLLHAWAGADYLRDRLGITDEDMGNAVRYHTTGRAGMSLLEKILYLADLTSAERDYPQAAQLRALADQSLEEAMLCSLEYIAATIPAPGADALAALEQYRRLYNRCANQ